MDTQPGPKALLQRIAALETELHKLRNSQENTRPTSEFTLADFENAAEGICVCHATDTPPYIRFICP